MPRGKAPDKELTIYRVFIDYAAAGIDTSYSTANKKIYENKAGVNQKIRAALDMGVHPKFIQVMEVVGTWEPSAKYQEDDSILVLCEACNTPFSEPSDDCPQLRVVLRINEARDRARASNPRYKDPNLERPHPELFMIDEVDLVG